MLDKGRTKRETSEEAATIIQTSDGWDQGGDRTPDIFWKDGQPCLLLYLGNHRRSGTFFCQQGTLRTSLRVE